MINRSVLGGISIINRGFFQYWLYYSLLYLGIQAAELLQLGQLQTGAMALQMGIRLHGRVHVHVPLRGSIEALVLEQLVVTGKDWD